MALVVGSDQIVEMSIPVYEQQSLSLEQYSTPIQTETIHSSNELKPDFCRSVLFYNESPYVSVRETIFVKKGDAIDDKGVSNI